MLLKHSFHKIVQKTIEIFQLNFGRSHSPRIPQSKGKLRFTALILAVSLMVIACNNVNSSESSSPIQSSVKANSLKVWWDKGFNPEEDEALRQLARNWEKQSGKKIDLLFYSTDLLGEKINRSLKAGNPPDIVMSFKAERSPIWKLAWDGKLVDVSNIIKPVEKQFTSAILENVNFYNNQTKKRSYYAVPIHQGTMHIYYWKDLLKQTGRSETDIPKEWDAFWNFWKQVQDDLRAKNKSQIYALGLTLSPEAGDTYYLFEQILEAYDVKVIDPKGELLIDQPQTRAGIIQVLKWYKDFYQQGYIPPDAFKWLNPDNNRSILNREIIMTPNATLSIPAAIRQDPDIYRNKLGILEFPKKPSNQPTPHLTMAEQAVILAESKHQELAKEFLRYMVNTQVKKDYLITAGGRNSPVLEPVWEDSFWTNPEDPHISTATKTIKEKRIRYFNISRNPAYSRVLDENIWGKALKRTIIDNISPQQAADEAIEKIKQIYQEWDNE